MINIYLLKDYLRLAERFIIADDAKAEVRDHLRRLNRYNGICKGHKGKIAEEYNQRTREVSDLAKSIEENNYDEIFKDITQRDLWKQEPEFLEDNIKILKQVFYSFKNMEDFNNS